MNYLRIPLPVIALSLLPLATPSAAQTVQNQDFVLGASDGQANDEFSSGIALDGDRLLSGAARADIGPVSNGDNQGTVYVFDFDGTTWVEQVILKASDAGLADEFGSDVALQGDRFLSGARLHDLTGANNEGAAYIFDFDGTTWSETTKLSASDAATGDNFASSVALEGNFAFCGSRFHDAPSTVLGDEGAVYVYEYDGTTWSEVQVLVASDAEEGELFGVSLGIDGNRLVIGANRENAGATTTAGAVYVFEYNGTSWLEVAKVVPSVRHIGQQFGTSVDVDGDRMLVGADGNDTTLGTTDAGALWVFDFDGTTWNETAKLEASDAQMNDLLGTSCSLQGDFAAGGAIFEDAVASNAGACYLYEFDGTTWTEIAKLQGSNGGIGDELGREVIVQGDLVLTSSRLAKPLVGSRVGALYGFDTSGNAVAMHADMIASPRDVDLPQNIQFSDASVGGATSWAWDFGDGGMSTLQNPIYAYSSIGSFDVSLSVTGALGSDSITKTNYIVTDGILASSAIRNGVGTNQLCYQPVTGPVLGGTLTTTVDGTMHPSAGLTLVLGYDLPFVGAPTAFGELLIAVEAIGGVFAFGTVVDSLGGVATHNSAVPMNLSFIGVTLATQAVILGGSGPELCNAIDYVIGL